MQANFIEFMCDFDCKTHAQFTFIFSVTCSDEMAWFSVALCAVKLLENFEQNWILYHFMHVLLCCVPRYVFTFIALLIRLITNVFVVLGAWHGVPDAEDGL